MTSLEHESNDTSVSASDYGNDMASDYGNDNWDIAGDMDVSNKFICLRDHIKFSENIHILKKKIIQYF